MQELNASSSSTSPQMKKTYLLVLILKALMFHQDSTKVQEIRKVKIILLNISSMESIKYFKNKKIIF